jgi:hypothetical protein
MKILIASAFILCFGCTQKSVDNIVKSDDSVLIKSYLIHQKANEIIKLADETSKEKIKEISEEVERLKIEAKTSKIQITKIDTVYITEKKNFWGRTKKTITSSETIKDTTIEE